MRNPVSSLQLEVVRLARISAPRAMNKLLTIMEGAEEPRVQLEAAKLVMAYAVGTPRQMAAEVVAALEAPAAATDGEPPLTIAEERAIARQALSTEKPTIN